MQQTMLKESFFFLPSYKYGHFKRNFFCGTNVEEEVEDVAFPVFGFAKTTAVVIWHTLFWSYNSRRLFQASAPLDQNGCPKNRENCSEMITGDREWYKGWNKKCNVVNRKKIKVQWIDWQVYHKKNKFCLLFAKSRAPRQDDGTFEDLSPRTCFYPRWDK